MHLKLSVFRCRSKDRWWWMELLVQPVSMRRHTCISNTHGLFFSITSWELSGIKLKLPSVGWSGGRRDSWEVHRARARPRALNLLYRECRSSVPISAVLKGNFRLGVKGGQVKLNLNEYKIVSVLRTGKVDKAEQRQHMFVSVRYFLKGFFSPWPLLVLKKQGGFFSSGVSARLLWGIAVLFSIPLMPFFSLPIFHNLEVLHSLPLLSCLSVIRE